MTTHTAPAAALRAAAARLRALATAASIDADGTPTTTWSAKLRRPADPDGSSLLYGDHRTREDGRRIAWPPLLRGGSQQRPTYIHTQHADYIATMGPGVGLAIADWLDSWIGVEISEHGPMPEDARHALAVARQVLGTTETHACDNCDGVDPGTCLTNPRPPAPAATEEPTP
ncbi:hypothetical protein ACIO8F_08060 [Streptomyces sp. NPDC087228]|uniref:hypothetical protein n=1 Tax=Streptomyces sp. NPDC087228 TaxID=3365772 RepID=UPI0037FB8C35